MMLINGKVDGWDVYVIPLGWMKESSARAPINDVDAWMNGYGDEVEEKWG